MKINRSKLRGSKLDSDCLKANISTNEYGIADNRCFCLGLEDASTECLLEKCIKCGAHVSNITPLHNNGGTNNGR